MNDAIASAAIPASFYRHASDSSRARRTSPAMSDLRINGPHGETFFDDKASSEADNSERPSSHCVEKGMGGGSALEDVRLDSTGLPLVPQPSRFKDDPLVSSHLLDVLYSLKAQSFRKPIVICNEIVKRRPQARLRNRILVIPSS